MALLFVTLLVIFGVAEIGVRSLLDVGQAEKESKRREQVAGGPFTPDKSRVSGKSAELPIYKTVFDLAQRNANGLHKGVRYRTNGIGFRGPDYARLPRPGLFRILITGDSVTAGEGVEEELIYSNVVE